MKGYIGKKHKKETLKALHFVRSQIESFQEQFICESLAVYYIQSLHYIAEAPNAGYISRKIKKYISDSLCGFFTYGDWLANELGTKPTEEECRRGRLAWLDRMIQEVENA